MSSISVINNNINHIITKYTNDILLKMSNTTNDVLNDIKNKFDKLYQEIEIDDIRAELLLARFDELGEELDDPKDWEFIDMYVEGEGFDEDNIKILRNTVVRSTLSIDELKTKLKNLQESCRQ